MDFLRFGPMLVRAVRMGGVLSLRFAGFRAAAVRRVSLSLTCWAPRTPLRERGAVRIFRRRSRSEPGRAGTEKWSSCEIHLDALTPRRCASLLRGTNARSSLACASAS